MGGLKRRRKKNPIPNKRTENRKSMEQKASAIKEEKGKDVAVKWETRKQVLL